MRNYHGFKLAPRNFFSFFTERNFSDNKINSTPLKLNSSLMNGISTLFLLSFLNSSVPTADNVVSDKNFRESGWVWFLFVSLKLYIKLDLLFHVYSLGFPQLIY